MDKVLLHSCCGPCSCYPLDFLRQQDFKVTAFFYNPNIHPYQEYERRLAAFRSWSALEEIPTISFREEDYELEKFLQAVVYREEMRCSACYAIRLEEAARIAKKGKFSYYTTSLLVSPYQKHELIRQIGENMGRKYGVKFYYADFRIGWKQGVAKSLELGLYRQPYCGCIYSEKERYYRKKKGK